MIKKLTELNEIVKTLKDMPADTKTQRCIQYPVIDVAKLPEVKKALWGFDEWAKEKGVEFESSIKRHFKLRGLKFDYTIRVLFTGTLKDVGFVLSNYIEILRSVNLVPSETEPHLHSITTEEEVKQSCSCCNEDDNEEEPWENCDNCCDDCGVKEECPNTDEN
jgi:hypothetical protein